jgi:hypothetical protein
MRVIHSSAIAIAVGISSTEAPAQQSASQRVYTTQVCKRVDTPWTNPNPRLDRVNATTALLDRQWLSDPRRGEADLTKLLAANSTLLQYARSNAAGCKERSCACPRTSKAAGTTLNQTLDPALARDSRAALDRLFRQDSVATFTGLMIFLREHPDLVSRVSNSLAPASTVRSAGTAVRTRPPGI